MAPVTVMIVDDSSVMRKIVERTLRQAGLEIDEVLAMSNGLEALNMLRSLGPECTRPSLIISDVTMPVMDGFAFVEQMRSEGLMQDVPVVMVTTEGTESQIRRALAAGASAYIRKPFTAEQLRASVVRLGLVAEG
jgi:two-component system chemotaxis response regulator CheY